MNCSCDDDQLEYLSKEIGVLLITLVVSLGQDWNNKLFTSWKTTLEGIVWEISTVKHIAPFEDEFSFSGMSSFLKITTPKIMIIWGINLNPSIIAAHQDGSGTVKFDC